MPNRARTRKLVGQLAFAVWVPLLLWVGTLLLGRHLLGLPAPSAFDATLTRDVARARGKADRGKWFALHILYAQCGCSQQVLASLLTRRPSPDLPERIVLVGDDATRAVSARDQLDPSPGLFVDENTLASSDRGRIEQAIALGYQIETMTADALPLRYHSEAAPLLVVADPTGTLRYVGGYTDRKRSPLVRTDELLARAFAGSQVDPLPVFGCAVSAKLQRQVNPLGLL